MAGVKERPSEGLEQKEQEERNRRLNALLDDALRMTFPASDPVAIIHESGTVVRTSCMLSRAPE
jgi:hypothetical protein